MIEWLIVAPIVLIAGLMVIQIALLWSTRHALEYAALQAVRHASVSHGEDSAIVHGLAVGMHAFWLAQLQDSRARVLRGRRAGWIRWRRLAPDDAVFSDFAGPSSASGRELANDNLPYRSYEPGAQSGLSVQDANQLRLQFDMGLPLIVPLAGPLLGRIMRVADGCINGSGLRLGVLFFGRPNNLTSRPWACPMYQLPLGPGLRPAWRLPVRVTVQAWMHSPLRPALRNSM